jgi:hypothetical protein
MSGKAGEHMVEKANPRPDLSSTHTIQIESKVDIRLSGFAIDDGNSRLILHEVFSMTPPLGDSFDGQFNHVVTRVTHLEFLSQSIPGLSSSTETEWILSSWRDFFMAETKNPFSFAFPTVTRRHRSSKGALLTSRTNTDWA